MVKDKAILLATTAWLLIALVACSGQSDSMLRHPDLLPTSLSLSHHLTC
jgi:hypothetical protein